MISSQLHSTMRLALAATLLGSLSLGVVSVRADDGTNSSCSSCCDDGSAKKADKHGKKAKQQSNGGAATASPTTATPGPAKH